MTNSTDVQDLLDATLLGLANGNVSFAMRNLAEKLSDAMQTSNHDEWKLICERTRSHPIHAVLLEDPYTRRAFEKPRGFAGDAVMLDFVYSKTPPPETSQLGKAIFAETTGHSNALSVLDRARRIATMIDDLYDQRSRFSALSVACGHMRELEMTKRLRADKVDLFLALDQDVEALAVVNEIAPTYGVTAQQLSVGKLIRQNSGAPKYDLVYASGIFDYLKNDIAAALTDALIRQLSPNGHLVIANYTPGNSGRAYMEAVMDWPLLYRDESELRRLIPKTNGVSMLEVTISNDEYKNIVYLEIKNSG